MMNVTQTVRIPATNNNNTSGATSGELSTCFLFRLEAMLLVLVVVTVVMVVVMVVVVVATQRP